MFFVFNGELCSTKTSGATLQSCTWYCQDEVAPGSEEERGRHAAMVFLDALGYFRRGRFGSEEAELRNDVFQCIYSCPEADEMQPTPRIFIEPSPPKPQEGLPKVESPRRSVLGRLVSMGIDTWSSSKLAVYMTLVTIFCLCHCFCSYFPSITCLLLHLNCHSYTGSCGGGGKAQSLLRT